MGSISPVKYIGCLNIIADLINYNLGLNTKLHLFSGSLLHSHFPVCYATDPADQRSHLARSFKGNPFLPLPRLGPSVWPTGRLESAHNNAVSEVTEAGCHVYQPFKVFQYVLI